MSKSARVFLVGSSAVLVVFIAIAGLLGQSYEKDELYKKEEIFIEVMNHIRNDYVEKVNTSAIFEGALKGMTRSLDSESSYLTAEEHGQYKKEIGQKTASCGIEVIKHTGSGYARVVHIRPDSPAAESGVQVGDFIRAVDGKSLRDFPIMLIDFYMRGRPGEKATLSILRPGVRHVLTVEVGREKLPPQKVTWKIIDGIGYIKIPSFVLGTVEQIKAACEALADAGVESVILDIRGNLQGQFEEAVHCADLFVSGGKLLTLKSKGGEVDYTATDFSYDLRLFLLCDESTGRAAEAFAVALSDRKIAVTVGRYSLGLGTVQKEIELDSGALLNISYAKVIGPDGTDYYPAGVKPAVEVPLTTDGREVDKILQTALERAKQQDISEEVAA